MLVFFYVGKGQQAEFECSTQGPIGRRPVAPQDLKYFEKNKLGYFHDILII